MSFIRQVIRAFHRTRKSVGDALIGYSAVGVLKLFRHADPDRLADAASWLMRTIGPFMPENRIGRENLVAAFPEKSPIEIDAILTGAWDNLGRMGAEFANLDRLWDFDPQHPDRGRITGNAANIGRFQQLRDDGKPALIFGAHLANWELPGIGAATYDLDTAVLYRRPNIPAIDRWLHETRTPHMGELISTERDAPLKLAAALQRGAHVGMLVDQYYVRGVPVTFFGRRTMANPLLARLARHFDCPIHGARMIRLPDHRFTGEITEVITPARDAEGKIDVAGTMQIITGVIEGWIREYPEQWLWLHRRWRPEDERR